MSWKRALFHLLGKDPEAVVVSFLSGPEGLALAMLREVTALVPDREHFAVTLGTPLPIEGVTFVPLELARTMLARKRIGLAPFLMNHDPRYVALRSAAIRMAPRKLLAYNQNLERHHLRLSQPVASALFLSGVPLDRIWLRPSWLWPFRRDRTVQPSTYDIYDGRTLTPGRARIAILSPYFPYPLSHGGAVRIYNLLRETSENFDIFFFSFTEHPGEQDLRAVLDLCVKVITVPLPRYREPRWSTLWPPEAGEFQSPLMAKLLADISARYQINLRQVEYTQLAPYGGDVLVEHDVTFDLYQQVYERARTASARWNLWRWHRLETAAVRRFRRVVVMSEKDARLLNAPNTVVIPNGVDLNRFQPEPERRGENILFIGSFRHFPNVVAFEFFAGEIWPEVRRAHPGAKAIVVAGPDHERFWRGVVPEGIELHGFVADVRPLYADANVVVVPTRESAGTNLKVLEAMAMQRAIVSTASGCAGIGLEHGHTVWIGDTAQQFAAGVVTLLSDPDLRASLAVRARRIAEEQYDWRNIAEIQKKVWQNLLSGDPVHIRRGNDRDITRLEYIESVSHLGANWEASTYLEYELTVAEKRGLVAGFIVSRKIAPDEREILNIAVDPNFRREGIATALIDSLPPCDVFLEVRTSNATAIALYRKLGFIEVGQRPDYYDNPVEDAVVMRRVFRTAGQSGER